MVRVVCVVGEEEEAELGEQVWYEGVDKGGDGGGVRG